MFVAWVVEEYDRGDGSDVVLHCMRCGAVETVRSLPGGRALPTDSEVIVAREAFQHGHRSCKEVA